MSKFENLPSEILANYQSNGNRLNLWSGVEYSYYESYRRYFDAFYSSRAVTERNGSNVLGICVP